VETFRDELDAEVRSILASSFKAVVTPTDTVPSVDDPDLTYPNLDTGEQRCKLLESCILHVDIRDSTVIGEKHRRETLVRLYSAFVRAMSRCAEHFQGRVRNIIGDRVMVLFDKENCFRNAVWTSILMNSVAQHIIDRYFSLNTIRCGIGIDYGLMLIAKTGVIKRGSESASSHSLVWLGRPANVASKLADEANKTRSWTSPKVMEGIHYKYINEFAWYDTPTSTFLDKLIETNSPILRHPDENFFAFVQSVYYHSRSMPPILMTQAVLDGFKAAQPDDNTIKKNLWKEQSLTVSGYGGRVFGGDVIYPTVKGT